MSKASLSIAILIIMMRRHLHTVAVTKGQEKEYQTGDMEGTMRRKIRETNPPI